jgi:hypothetical protein
VLRVSRTNPQRRLHCVSVRGGLLACFPTQMRACSISRPACQPYWRSRRRCPKVGGQEGTKGKEHGVLSVMSRAGQNRIYITYMTVYLVISLPKIPYINRIYIWFWPTRLIGMVQVVRSTGDCPGCMQKQIWTKCAGPAGLGNVCITVKYLWDLHTVDPH